MALVGNLEVLWLIKHGALARTNAAPYHNHVEMATSRMIYSVDSSIHYVGK
jgi:hypothetical protein